MDLESIKGLLDDFDLAALLPDVETILENLPQIMRLLVMAGPVVMLVMGLLYYFAAPKEANHHFGYRCYFGMGSVNAWRYTQRVAGITWMALGVILGVAMLITSGDFAGQDTLDMVLEAIFCVLWQAGLLLAASFLIRTIVAFRFNRHGEYRQKK